MERVAILVDGGFYRKRAKYLFGEKTAEKRAEELIAYCTAHIKFRYNMREQQSLYRIFYYDCPPYEKNIFHPLLNTNINMRKTDLYLWSTLFLEELKSKRKVALRLGMLSDITAKYQLKYEVQKLLLNKSKNVEDLQESDFEINIEQKGVDLKIGLDIATLAYKKLVDRIILISADSDFVPAAKLARIEGIDFILDPMWSDIKPQLYEHIDGLQSQFGNKKKTLASHAH